MKSSTEYKKQNFALLLVGEPKSGKSNVALSFPDPYVYDCDRNLARAARVTAGKTWYYDDPYISDDGKEVLAKDRWNLATKRIVTAAKDPKIKTVVIDGLGLFTEMLIPHILNEVLKNEGKTFENLRIQDYRAVLQLLTQFTLALRTSGKYVIVTSHQRVDIADSGKVTYSLAIPGQLKDTYSGLFSDVWATKSSNVGGKIKYELFTKPSGNHVNLGTSTNLAPSLDITDKTPEAIWGMVGPFVEGTK